MNRLEIRNLGTLGYIHGLTHWAYKAGDHSAATVMEMHYWSDAHNMLAPGDWIFVSGKHFALQLYVMQTARRVVVSLVSAAGALGELPPPDYPDDYLAELENI